MALCEAMTRRPHHLLVVAPGQPSLVPVKCMKYVAYHVLLAVDGRLPVVDHDVVQFQVLQHPCARKGQM